jgi:hypothetical protein
LYLSFKNADKSMRLLFIISISLRIATASFDTVAKGIELVNGLRYFPSSEPLRGMMLFHVKHNTQNLQDYPTNGSVYGLNLGNGYFRKLFDTTGSFFSVSKDGNFFSTIEYGARTNLHAWSKGAPVEQIVPFSGGVASLVVTENGSVVIESDGGLYHFEFGQTNISQLKELSAKKRVAISRQLIPPLECTNVVQFYRNKYGDADWEYRLLEYKSQSLFTFRSFDGKYVFFADGLSPAQGRVLGVGSQSYFEYVSEGIAFKARAFRAVSTLPRSGIIHAEEYFLNQISPDGRYAVVRLQQPVAIKAGDYGGYRNRYYIANLETGKAHKLIDDNVQHVSLDAVAYVGWVPDPL